MPSPTSAESLEPLESTAGGPPRRETRSLFGDLCELWALLAFAVAQPIYSRLVGRPMFLDRQTDGSLWLLVGLLSVAAPLLLAVVSSGLSRVQPRVYRAWHALAWIVLAGLLIQSSVRHVMPAMPYPLAAVVLVGLTAAFAVLRRRVAGLGTVLRVASVGSVLFPAVFWVQAHSHGGDPRRNDAAAKIRHPVPVVMVVFDEFCGVSLMDANRELNAARYPGFAELASDATWYRNATSVHPRTDRAVPALLSGRFPDRDVEPLEREYPQNLFTTILRGPTYVPVVLEPYTRLYPIERMKRYPDGSRFHDSASEMLRTLGLAYLQELLPEDLPYLSIDLPLSWFNLRDPSEEVSRRTGLIRHGWDRYRSEQVDQFLECISPRPQPALYFAHLCLPHYPWCFLPSGRRYADDVGISGQVQMPGANGVLKEDWGPDELATDQACAAYILQTQYADLVVSRLIARLKETGLYDECLLVIAGDHGVSFRPNRSRRLPAADSLADILSVPLFVKLPHQTTGGVSDRNVETIDVFPTMAEVLGMDLSDPVDGVSFLDPTAPEKAVKRFRNEDGVIEVDGVFEEKYAVLASLIGRFGGGRSPERMYRLGPHAELIGRPVAELRSRVHSGWSALVDQPRTMRADEQFVPARLFGSVTSLAGQNLEVSRPLTLAIAVNGVIRGTTRTFAQREFREQWSVLLPEEAFATGDNRVEVLVLAEAVGDAAPN